MKSKKKCSRCGKLSSVVSVSVIDGDTVYLCLECDEHIKKEIKECLENPKDRPLRFAIKNNEDDCA